MQLPLSTSRSPRPRTHCRDKPTALNCTLRLQTTPSLLPYLDGSTAEEPESASMREQLPPSPVQGSCGPWDRYLLYYYDQGVYLPFSGRAVHTSKPTKSQPWAPWTQLVCMDNTAAGKEDAPTTERHARERMPRPSQNKSLQGVRYRLIILLSKSRSPRCRAWTQVASWGPRTRQRLCLTSINNAGAHRRLQRHLVTDYDAMCHPRP